jgi:oxygen-dependent protoporphyrinogen oxidase
MRVAIIGAGISGLATAFYLQRARPDTALTIFESGSLAGGSLRTIDVQGFLFEAGGNGFLTNKPDCLQLVQDAGGAHLLLPSSELARKRFIYDGRLQRMPESPPLFARSKLLTGPQKLRMLGELFVRARRDDVDESLRDFGNRRLGAGFTDVFLDAMSAGIYGSTPDKISVRAAFPLIVALEREHGGLLRGMLARRKKGAGPGGVLTSTVRGISSMTSHLRDVITADWHFDEPVHAVVRHDRGWRVDSRRGTAEFDQVAVCSPSFTAATLVQDLDDKLAQQLSAIEYSPIAVVGLGYRSLQHPLDGFGLLTTTASSAPVLGVLWDSSIFPDRAPAGCKSMRVMIGGQRQPELVAQDDAGLLQTALQGIEQTMGVRDQPDVTYVQRWERGIPSYAPGHLARVGAIFTTLDRHPGLHLNCNAYRGIAMNDCARNGRELAQRIAQERGH